MASRIPLPTAGIEQAAFRANAIFASLSRQDRLDQGIP